MIDLLSKKNDNIGMKFVKQLSIIGSSVLLISQAFGANGTEKTAPAELKASDKSTEIKVENKNTTDQAAEVKVENKDAIATEPTQEQKLTYFKTLGWLTIMQSGIKNLGTDASEKEAFLQGASLAIEDKDSPCKLGDIMDPMQKFLQKRSEDYAKKHQEELKVIAEKNRKAGQEFMVNTKQKDSTIKTTPSGLSYKIISEGDQNIKATDEDSVEIFYTGKLIDGKIFDESKNDSPITFPLNGVVPGIKEGLQLIGQGGKVTLYIPDNLAYGEYDIPSIPAGSLLVFDVELVKVTKAEKPAVPESEKAKDVDVKK